MSKFVTEIIVVTEDTETHNQELHSLSGNEIMVMQGAWCLYTVGGPPHVVDTNVAYLEKLAKDTYETAIHIVQLPPLAHQMLDIVENRAPVLPAIQKVESKE